MAKDAETDSFSSEPAAQNAEDERFQSLLVDIQSLKDAVREIQIDTLTPDKGASRCDQFSLHMIGSVGVAAVHRYCGTKLGVIVAMFVLLFYSLFVATYTHMTLQLCDPPQILLLDTGSDVSGKVIAQWMESDRKICSSSMAAIRTSEEWASGNVAHSHEVGMDWQQCFLGSCNTYGSESECGNLFEACDATRQACEGFTSITFVFCPQVGNTLGAAFGYVEMLQYVFVILIPAAVVVCIYFKRGKRETDKPTVENVTPV